MFEYSLRTFSYIFERSWAIIILLLSFLIKPEFINSTPSLCLFKNITGHECLGCGMSRAFVSFFHFHFHEFYNYNILSTIVIPIVIFLAIKQIINVIKAVKTA